MTRNIFTLILALAGSALAYAFSGGYHPVPHITPHFSSPVHVSPHFTAPHVTTAPHYTPTPHVSTPSTQFESHPYVNPAHPMYWVYHRNPTTGKTDSVLSGDDGQVGGRSASKIIFWGSLIGVIGGAGLFWLVRRFA